MKFSKFVGMMSVVLYHITTTYLSPLNNVKFTREINSENVQRKDNSSSIIIQINPSSAKLDELFELVTTNENSNTCAEKEFSVQANYSQKSESSIRRHWKSVSEIFNCKNDSSALFRQMKTVTNRSAPTFLKISKNSFLIRPTTIQIYRGSDINRSKDSTQLYFSSYNDKTWFNALSKQTKLLQKNDNTAGTGNKLNSPGNKLKMRTRKSKVPANMQNALNKIATRKIKNGRKNIEKQKKLSERNHLLLNNYSKTSSSVCYLRNDRVKNVNVVSNMSRYKGKNYGFFTEMKVQRSNGFNNHSNSSKTRKVQIAISKNKCNTLSKFRDNQQLISNKCSDFIKTRLIGNALIFSTENANMNSFQNILKNPANMNYSKKISRRSVDETEYQPVSSEHVTEESKFKIMMNKIGEFGKSLFKRQPEYITDTIAFESINEVREKSSDASVFITSPIIKTEAEENANQETQIKGSKQSLGYRRRKSLTEASTKEQTKSSKKGSTKTSLKGTTKGLFKSSNRGSTMTSMNGSVQGLNKSSTAGLTMTARNGSKDWLNKSSTVGSMMTSMNGSTVMLNMSSTNASTKASSKDTTKATSEGSSQASLKESTKASPKGTTKAATKGSSQASTKKTINAAFKGSTKASTKGSTKSSSKGTTKVTSKGSTKASSKGSTKSSSKETTKATAKGTTKASSKGTTKASSKGTTKASSKGTTKASSKATTKASSKGTTKASSMGSTKAASKESSQASPKETIKAASEGSTIVPLKDITKAAFKGSMKAPSKESAKSSSKGTTKASLKGSTEASLESSIKESSNTSTKGLSKASLKGLTMFSTERTSKDSSNGATKGSSKGSTKSSTKGSTKEETKTKVTPRKSKKNITATKSQLKDLAPLNLASSNYLSRLNSSENSPGSIVWPRHQLVKLFILALPTFLGLLVIFLLVLLGCRLTSKFCWPFTGVSRRPYNVCLLR